MVSTMPRTTEILRRLVAAPQFAGIPVTVVVSPICVDVKSPRPVTPAPPAVTRPQARQTIRAATCGVERGHLVRLRTTDPRDGASLVHFQQNRKFALLVGNWLVPLRPL